MAKQKSRKRLPQQKYSRTAKHFSLAGMVLVLLLIVVVAFTNRTQADLSFRQPRQDLIMYITANTQAAQSLPAEQCWNRKLVLPVVVDRLPVGIDRYYLDIAVDTLDSRSGAIRSTQITITEGLHEITFNTPKAPAGKPDCYLRFSANADQDLYGLWISEGNTIDAGTMFFNGQPVDYDLVFNSYKPIQMQSLLSAFGNAVLPSLQILGVSLLYLLIGLSSQILLKKEEENLRPIPVLFLGIASVMLLVLGLSTLNIRYANWMLFTWTGIFVMAAAIKLLLKHNGFESAKNQLAHLHWQDFLIVVGFLLLLLTRIAQADPLLVPSWMDSLFHANIVQGFLEQGQIPSNLNYHFGYHLLTFLNSQLFQWNIPTAMLITGQWLNALLSLALFSFVERRFNNRNLAIFSVLLFSLFAIFPAYLVNWSRFSILLGTAFGLIITGNLFHAEQKWSLSLIMITGILLLAQFISHYTSIVLTGFIGMVLAYPLLKGLNLKKLKEKIKERTPPRFIIGAGIVVLATGAFVTTRIISLARGGEFGDIFTSSQNLTEQFSLRYFWNLSADASGWFFLLLAAAGILLMALNWKKAKEIQHFQTSWLWFVGLIFFVGIQVILLGGSQPSLTNIFIWSFIPLAISGGVFQSTLLETLSGIYPAYKRYLPSILVGLMGLTGIFISPVMVNPLTVMYTASDQQAITWMQTNLTEDDWILINAQPFEDRLQPSDGGGWIPYLTDLHITYPDQDELDSFTEWFTSIDIDYLYQGSLGIHYDLDALKSICAFIPVFQSDGVTIYQVSPLK